MKNTLINHYDLLIDENNDPVNDPPELKDYMNKWDGDIFIESLNLTNNKNVLEIGVGTGRLALRVIDKCKSFTGIDMSSKTIERAKIHLGDQVNLICADFNEYSFNQIFDVIYSSLTFIHFEDKETVLEKCLSLLRKDGVVVISIDKSDTEILEYGSRKIELFPISKEQFYELCIKVGFKGIEIKEVEFAYIFILKR